MWGKCIAKIPSNFLVTKKGILKYNGILLPKLFWLTMRKKCYSDWENFWNSRLNLRSLEQFIQTMVKTIVKTESFGNLLLYYTGDFCIPYKYWSNWNANWNK